MDERAIKVSEVQVSTASIEVHVLRLGNKQITQAVFKQIPEKNIIELDTIKVVWGWVDYHNPACSNFYEIKSKGHLHYIWVEDGELRRGLVHTFGIEYYRGLGEKITKEEISTYLHNDYIYECIKENTPQLFIAV